VAFFFYSSKTAFIFVPIASISALEQHTYFPISYLQNYKSLGAVIELAKVPTLVITLFAQDTD
jgi:hypothetical protein